MLPGQKNRVGRKCTKTLQFSRHLQLLEGLENHPLTQGLWAVGKYFLVIGEIKNWTTLYLSPSVEEITGFGPREAFPMGAELLVQFTHSEDFPINMAHNKLGVDRLFALPEAERSLATITLYYRGVHQDGRIIFVQHQSFPIGFDAYGVPYVFANICTDISHLKVHPTPRAFFLNRCTSSLEELHHAPTNQKGTVLKITKREKEVLGWLAQGHSSKQIAEELKISFHTVQTYRKRLLEKTEVSNTSELINFAYLHSLIG